MSDMYDASIKAAVEKHLPFYDWTLYKAQLWQESRLNPTAVSPANAVGVAQFTPMTWSDWAHRAGYDGADRTNPEASIFTGACYMAALIGKWKAPRPDIDRWCLAMASYNAGFGHIINAQKRSGDKPLYADIIKHLVNVTGDKNSKETKDYVRKILTYWSMQVVEGQL